MSDITVHHYAGNTRYVLEALLEEINMQTLDEIREKAPKIIAEQYVKEHMQEIMDKISATEVVSCIAAAVAQKVADAYKPQTMDMHTSVSGIVPPDPGSIGG